MTRESLCRCIVLLVMSSIGALTIANGPQRGTAPTYDGHWWLSISSNEQLGFLDGYYDCYTYEFKGPAHFTKNPPAVARDLITKFYETAPSHLGESVSSVFCSLRDQAGGKGVVGGGEPISGPHGYYDGLYWSDLYQGGTSGQRGFVEGYLDCHVRLNQDRGGTFSRPPADYVALINRWYGFVPLSKSAVLKRESMPIATVLFKFSDDANK